MKVWMFAVFCLPFSLWNSLLLEFPLSTIYSNPTVSTVTVTILHLLCTAHFCLNFIVYTILCGPVGQTYLKLASRAKLSVLSVFQSNRNRAESSRSSTSSVSRKNSSSVSLVTTINMTEYRPQKTHL